MQRNENAKPEILSSNLLNSQEDFVLLDDASGSESLLFIDPVRIISSPDPADFESILGELDCARNEGLYTAGYFNYEAADPAAGISEKPMMWFGCYREFRSVRIDAAFFNPAGTFSLRSEKNSHSADILEKRKFFQAYRTIRNHLYSGDVYQINYTMRREYRFNGDAFLLYKRLRESQRARHCAFIKNKHKIIMSLSPELFFNADREREGTILISTRPMKGTSSRGRTDAEDQIRKDALAGEKNRAENTMIVDLVRNDLSMHSMPGSVQASDLFSVISLPTLHQMVSTVRGRFASESNKNLLYKIFTSLFPAGSVTGAPKHSARSIISKIENTARGVYTGSIGYASADGLASFNVAIRTLEIDRAVGDAPDDSLRARYGSGCGIVWDSEKNLEWEEYRLKQSFLKSALDEFALIETMLFQNGELLFLYEHLKRMAAGALFFGFPFSADHAADYITAAVKNENDCRRIRLTLDRNGVLEHSISQAGPINAAGFRRKAFLLKLSSRRIFSGDPFRARKTTERHLYDREFARMQRIGADDVFFLNEKDEVTETCIGNLLLYSQSGEWSTPHEESGALGGVFLSVLERLCPGRIQRKKILLEEMAAAKVVFVCNSVRGFQRVTGLEMRPLRSAGRKGL